MVKPMVGLFQLYALDKENVQFGICKINFLSIFFHFFPSKREKWRDSVTQQKNRNEIDHERKNSSE